jgi:iron-sulfur cluster repair protein YtfE (RIC family)
MHGNLLATNWSLAPLRELIRYIVLEYHDCLRLELPELARRMYEPSTQARLRAFEEALEVNLGQQEEVLFPAIGRCEKAADSGLPFPTHAISTILDLVPKMKRDQQQLFALLNEVREHAGVDEPGLKGLEADLRVHIQLEDNILFERALQLVSLTH